MPKSKLIAWCAGLLQAALLTIILAAPASAWEIKVREWGMGPLYASDLNLHQANLQEVGMLGHAATVLWQGQATRLDGRLEGLVGKFWNYSSGVELALVPALRFYLLDGREHGLGLYAEGGVGPSYTNLNVRELGIAFNFLSFAGMGIRLPITSWGFLDLGYRLRHVSNAGLDENNCGLSSHQVLAEITYEF